MKSNRTNCNLNTCIKKRRVYFKDRFYSKKSRLLSFLFLIKTTFFILFENFNDKTKLAFQNLCFCKKFFRFRVLNGSPDLKFVNSKRGAARRSPETTQSNRHVGQEILTPSSLTSYVPILTSNDKFKCTYCDKTYASNGRWLHNHLRSCQNNPINENISFIRNNHKFNVKINKVKNFFPKNLTTDFLKDFNISPCDKNILREKLADDSDVFMDTAFTGVATQAVTQQQNVFEKQSTCFLTKHSRNLKISALNINSIQNKIGDILFLLNQQLIDILVIGESKLDETKDESLYQHPSYELYRRDRVGKGGGGLMVYVKKNLQSSRVTFDNNSEIISLVIKADKSKIGIIACYRPPYTHNETDFFSSLDEQIKNLDSESPVETLILGDLNFDMQDKMDSKKLTDFNASNGFTNTILTPTRLDPSSGKETLLDVILSSSPTSCLASIVIPYSRSDHRLIISIFNFKAAKYKYCKIPTRCIDDKKMKLIKDEIKKQFSFYDFDLINDSNLRWQAIKSVISNPVEDI